ncbi:DUF6518 family protein [Frondihabitans peucedani]|uniref:Uncharacterized protein n=1 Tax=Frondihabitans peucedani TaxID=598626 RepID=A0ABP8E095_9MICO
MTPLDTSAARRPALARALPSGLAAAAVVVLGALLVGGLTSLGQQYLPSWLTSLANSSGGWSLFAFLLVWLVRARPALAAVLGALAFVAMVEAYGLVSGWRGYFYAAPFSSRWTLIGLFAGPVIGVAASLARSPRHARRIGGVAILSTVLVAEGAYGLVTLLGSTSPVYWTLEVVAGAAFLAAAIVRRRA